MARACREWKIRISANAIFIIALFPSKYFCEMGMQVNHEAKKTKTKNSNYHFRIETIRKNKSSLTCYKTTLHFMVPEKP